MQRPCDSCGLPYEAKRPASKFCSDTCRKRSQRSANEPVMDAPTDAAPSPLAEMCRAELEAVGRLDTLAGMRAVHLAALLGAATADSGSSKAALDKQLAAAMEQAMDGARGKSHPMDELVARRERRRA